MISQKRRKDDFVKKIERMMDASLVWIDEQAIEALDLGALPEGGIGAGEPAPKEAATELDVIRFALAANAINHQFWDVVDGKFERYRHGQDVGAMAMMSGMRRMLEEAGSFDALEARLPLKVQDIERWFGPMPDPAGRAQALGEALGRKGKAAAMLLSDASRDGEAWGIDHAGAIASLLPSGYEDPLLKKAQLCLWMAKGMLEARQVVVTCFADYQVPKVLRGLGILKYADPVASRVDSGNLIAQDDPIEVAIRAATVVACERVAKAKGVSPHELDYLLWTKRNDFPQPFHRVRTRRY